MCVYIDIGYLFKPKYYFTYYIIDKAFRNCPILKGIKDIQVFYYDLISMCMYYD